MSEQAGTRVRRSRRGRTLRRWRRQSALKRRIIGTTVIVLGLIIIVGAYLGYLAVKAKGELESARTHANAARSAVLDGNVAKAKSEAALAATDSSDANSRTHNPVWSAVGAIPWLGDPLDSVASISDVVKDLSTDVLTPTAELATTLDPNTLRTGAKGINTVALFSAEPKLAAIATSAEAIDARAQGIDGSWVKVVADARDQLRSQTTKLSRFIRGTDTAAKLLPPMLGANGERRYFFAFQTPAESRATGGLLGAYSIISARTGKVSVDKLGPNTTLKPPTRPINLGPDFDSNYGISRPYIDSRNSNVSTHFPYAAQIWMSMWQQQSGQKLDGALATDPIALSYVLKATGPITLADGEKITGDNVVPITLSTSYKRFGGDNPQRKAYLQQIASKAIDTISNTRGNTGAVLEALGRAVLERRLMIYSSQPDEQKLLVESGLAHEVPETTAPYADVAIGNLAGNKIDYYLKRTISYEAGACTGSTRKSMVSVTLKNTVTDLTLPAYVIGGLGNPQLRLEPGMSLANVSLDATNGAVLQSVLVDGGSTLYGSGLERGHLHAMTQVRIPAGKTVTVVFTLIEPTSAKGPAIVPIQPLVDTPTVRVVVPECK